DAEQDGRHLARLAGGPPARAIVRVPCGGTVRAACRLSLQLRELALGPVLDSNCGRPRTGFLAVGWVRSIPSEQRSGNIGDRQRSHRSEIRRAAFGLRLE